MSQDIEDILITSKGGGGVGRERHLVEAMVVERRSPSELARSHGVARSWLYKLLARFREGGYQSLEQRSRRPHVSPLLSSPRRASAAAQAEVAGLRRELTQAGFDRPPPSGASSSARGSSLPSPTSGPKPRSSINLVAQALVTAVLALVTEEGIFRGWPWALWGLYAMPPAQDPGDS